MPGLFLLTHKLLKGAGIQNKIVEGTAYASDNPQGQLHAWNLVLLDGKWYHLDTTWNDPVPDRDNEVSYTYYLRTDEQMGRDHTWVKSIRRRARFTATRWPGWREGSFESRSIRTIEAGFGISAL